MHRFFQTIGGALLCPFVFLVALLGVTDYEQTETAPWGEVVLIFGGALRLILGMSVALLLPTSRLRSASNAISHLRRKRAPRTSLPVWLNPSYVTVGVGALALTGTAIMGGFAQQCGAGNPAVVLVALALTFGALVNQAVRFFHPPDEFSPNSTQERIDGEIATSALQRVYDVPSGSAPVHSGEKNDRILRHDGSV